MRLPYVQAWILCKFNIKAKGVLSVSVALPTQQTHKSDQKEPTAVHNNPPANLQQTNSSHANQQDTPIALKTEDLRDENEQETDDIDGVGSNYSMIISNYKK